MSFSETALIFSQKRFKGWILDAFWRESSKALGLNPYSIYLYSSKIKNLTLNKRKILKEVESRSVLSIHHSNLMLLENIGLIKQIRSHNVIITHTDSVDTYLMLASHFRKNKRIRFLVMNKKVQSSLISVGIPKQSIELIYGAIDRKIFFPNQSKKQGDYILIAGHCKPRKNPNKVLDLVINNPKIKFMFESHSWKEVILRNKVCNSHISFWDGSDLSRGDLYRNASVLCNLSFLEGGPIPVLQALASGTPILSSDVGFVREVVKDGFGRLIDLDLSIQQISEHLSEVAFTKESVSTLDGLEGKYSWEELGQKLFTFTQ